MANEMVVTRLFGNNGDRMEFTCAAGTAIAKGELLELEDLKTVKKISADNKPIAGIAAYEKTAADLKTTMTVITNCEVKCIVGATQATVGFKQAAHAGDNTICDGDAADNDEGLTCGTALETGATGESIFMRLLTLT